MSDSVVVEADGGSRGNPGIAGYGALVRDARTGDLLAERAEGLGFATNNVAEYAGLIAGLTAAREVGARKVEVRMDSKLVVEQMSGRWKVKHPDMIPLAAKASAIARDFDEVTYEWIPRAQNSGADALANSAMDGVPVHRSADSSVTSSGQPTTLLLIAVGDPEDVPGELAKHLSARGDVRAVVTTAPSGTDWSPLPVEIEPDLLEPAKTETLLARLRGRGDTVVVLASRERVADILRIALEAPPRLIGRFRLDDWGVSEVEFGGPAGAVVRTVNDSSATRAV